MIELQRKLMVLRSLFSADNTDLVCFQAVVRTCLTDKGVVTVERGLHLKLGIAARNSYRWTFTPDGTRLHLAHLRFGPEHPVELTSFDLTAPIEHGDGSTEYRALAPHRCKDDLYDATLLIEPEGSQVGDLCCHGDLVLTWHITGPKKDQTIVTRYSSKPLVEGLCHQEPQVGDLCYKKNHLAGFHVVKM